VRDSFETLTGESQLSDILLLNLQIVIILKWHWIGAGVIGAAGIPAVAVAFVCFFAGFSSTAFAFAGVILVLLVSLLMLAPLLLQFSLLTEVWRS
jgi:hypothetical protein